MQQIKTKQQTKGVKILRLMDVSDDEMRRAH
jgi:hypothetical protein